MYINCFLNRGKLMMFRYANARHFSQLNSTERISKLLDDKRLLFQFSRSNGLIRYKSNRPRPFKTTETIRRSKDFALYGVTLALLALAVTYASVPLYRLYCQSTGKGGKAKIADDFLANKVKVMKKKKEKLINVTFIAEKEAKMRWNFRPTQNEIKVYPGETALAFFTAKNPTTLPVNGVSTYSVSPVEAGQYLNKIQCFCFEEQRLDPGEEVDMPVFFYFDPEFANDPRLNNVNEVSLSYTFFEAKEGFKLPSIPSFIKPKNAIQPI